MAAEEEDVAAVSGLFRSIDTEGRGYVFKADVIEALEGAGLRSTDVRLAECMRRLGQFKRRDPISPAQLAHLVAPCLNLVERALQGRLIVPKWAEFCHTLREIFELTRAERGGANADYIPVLARADPESYGMAVCTVDGQVFSLGDCNVDVCVQSCSKPITYLATLMEHGDEHVHRYVGREPSGVRFNALVLNEHRQPHNPYINSGAIMCASLLMPERPIADRFGHLLALWKRLAGGGRVGYSNTVYLSERGTADRNFALAYLMKGEQSFPPGTDIVKTLEIYFQCCSIEVTCESGAAVAATLANDGVCPLTGDKVIANSLHVRNALSLMTSCGMYDFSGEFAFSIGLPAKSGVAGLIMLTVPGVCGICIWSPRLDKTGNSQRGIAFCRELVKRFRFHRYDSQQGARSDSALGASQAALVAEMLQAAHMGDVATLKQMLARNMDINATDYDKRTALHVAAADNQAEAVVFLLRHGADKSARDRWNRTPLDEAKLAQHSDVIGLLTGATTMSPRKSVAT